MVHTEVYKAFKNLFPMYAEETLKWFSNGRNSIRLQIPSVDQEMIFTYNTHRDWKFESIDSYISLTMLKEKRNEHSNNRKNHIRKSHKSYR